MLRSENNIGNYKIMMIIIFIIQKIYIIDEKVQKFKAAKTS